MTTTRIDFDMSQAEAVLLQVAARVTDMRPVMDQIGEVLVETTIDRFKTDTAPDGTAWAPNTEATLKRKRGTKPLIGNSRVLSQAISYEATETSVSWGSNLIYAAVHQLGAGKGVFGTMANGSPIPWGDIPARPYLGISEGDNLAIIAALEGFLEAG